MAQLGEKDIMAAIFAYADAILDQQISDDGMMKHDDEDDDSTTSCIQSTCDSLHAIAGTVEAPHQEQANDQGSLNDAEVEGCSDGAHYDVQPFTEKDYVAGTCKMYELDPELVHPSWRQRVENAIRCRKQREQQQHHTRTPECLHLCQMSVAELESLKENLKLYNIYL